MNSTCEDGADRSLPKRRCWPVSLSGFRRLSLEKFSVNFYIIYNIYNHHHHHHTRLNLLLSVYIFGEKKKEGYGGATRTSQVIRHWYISVRLFQTRWGLQPFESHRWNFLFSSFSHSFLPSVGLWDLIESLVRNVFVLDFGVLGQIAAVPVTIMDI